MGFNFVIVEIEEDTLDLSDILGDDEEEEKIEVSSFELAFTEEVPEARTISDPEVRTKAQESRSKRPGSYADKVAAGWSYCCAHKRHLPNLCEREQDRGVLTCTCECHEARGYERPEPERLHRSDDEEEILIFD